MDELEPAWVSLGHSWGAGVSFDCPTHRAAHRLVILFQNPVDGFSPNPDHSTPKHQRAGASFSGLTLTSSFDLGACFHGWLVEGEFVVAGMDH